MILEVEVVLSYKIGTQLKIQTFKQQNSEVQQG